VSSPTFFCHSDGRPNTTLVQHSLFYPVLLVSHSCLIITNKLNRQAIFFIESQIRAKDFLVISDNLVSIPHIGSFVKSVVAMKSVEFIASSPTFFSQVHCLRVAKHSLAGPVVDATSSSHFEFEFESFVWFVEYYTL